MVPLKSNQAVSRRVRGRRNAFSKWPGKNDSSGNTPNNHRKGFHLVVSAGSLSWRKLARIVLAFHCILCYNPNLESSWRQKWPTPQNKQQGPYGCEILVGMDNPPPPSIAWSPFSNLQPLAYKVLMQTQQGGGGPGESSVQLHRSLQLPHLQGQKKSACLHV